ncbi:MAG: hypothetical protein PHC61_03920 [Chitinivibrionales bacterium]|nr:hypothetical protein [Chitinivibrionales bacterium]
MSRVILFLMKEFDGYDEDRELFDEIRVIKSPEKSIIDRILEQVEAK